VDCPHQDNCWRLNAPPDLHQQSYNVFVFNEETFECDGYIPMDELSVSQLLKQN